jgi:hypothetical protein
MATELLFKYRSLDNWKFLLDILLKQRLFAAAFRSLNDPMEGRYYYYGDEVTKAFRRSVRVSKDYWKICSLSTKPKNTLMWSYYAGGHTGLALGVRVRARAGQCIRPVRYDSEVSIGPHHVKLAPRDVALEILSQKQLNWEHESEVRVFSHLPFVKIELKRVVLGCQMSDADQQLIIALARRLAPRAKVQRLLRKDLDAPLDQFA